MARAGQRAEVAMNSREDVVVVGAGIGGLTAAVCLGAAGLRVRVVESGLRVGGKAGVQLIDGIEVDTGPSLLTLPGVFEEVFALAGQKFDEAVGLTQTQPAFHYCFGDGTELLLQNDLERSVAAVERCFSADAASEFRGYLEHAGRVWRTAAPEFVFAPAPGRGRILELGPRRLFGLTRVDPFGSMERGIARYVRHPHLRDLFRRFATYSGSDVRKAPGTLACIAHVELVLGAYGVRGGLNALACALERAASAVGVEFDLGRRVKEVLVSGSAVSGVSCDDGGRIGAARVVLNVDAGAVRAGLLGDHLRGVCGKAASGPPSMSAYTGIVRARRRTGRSAHTVLFPDDYLQEFVDIFDRGRLPSTPAIYVCALEPAHGRAGWKDDEPLFVMVNAPALSATRTEEPEAAVRERVLRTLVERGQLEPSDRFVWWRSPAGLAREFPGSHGALYGSAFHGLWAAFQRTGGDDTRIQGLHFASGSGHPGGGVPLAALSGRRAAEAVLRRLRRSA